MVTLLQNMATDARSLAPEPATRPRRGPSVGGPVCEGSRNSTHTGGENQSGCNNKSKQRDYDSQGRFRRKQRWSPPSVGICTGCVAAQGDVCSQSCHSELCIQGGAACFFRVRAAGRAPPPASGGSFLGATAQRQLSRDLESRRQTIDLPSGQPSKGCAQTSKI